MKKLLYLSCLMALSGCVAYGSADPSAQAPGPGPYAGGHPMGPPPEGMPPGPPPGGFPPGGPGSHQVITGDGAYVLSDAQVLKGGSYESSRDDENVIRAQGYVHATLDNVTVNKRSGIASSNEAASFYGLNAAVLALDHADLIINGGSIHALAQGATGVFAYDHALVHINHTKIDVSGGNAGGIEVAGGATMYANDLNVHARDKAAIRSDRGGGKIFVHGGSYTTAGRMGAPAIYSTADIKVSSAKLVSHDSEAVVIEGLNSVSLANSDVIGHMDGTNPGKDGANIRNVMLYQSMSGDAQQGTSTFSMSGGALTSENGNMFYVTNTSSVINLYNVYMHLAKSSKLLLVAGNDGKRGWGKVGANGGHCTLNLSQQKLSGEIKVDGISDLTMNLAQSSDYQGAINPDGTKANVSVTLDDSSSWTLTHDSYIQHFHGSLSQVHLNGHKLYINGALVQNS
ncbi:hypothetical protein [Celerinatantimonas sp. MCCC 1A17872]|uniref:hypothetical protein n=1 Tax=Celerinatantimonas sp. MCCC 1A17872 TaxID=3177514 RepID=UPI0038C57DC4